MVDRNTLGKRIALVSIGVCILLSVSKITIGLLAHSTSVVADGVESAGDVLASSFVFLGLLVAAKPADKDHPYGHGRYETLTGLTVGFILIFVGIAIAVRSLATVGNVHEPPEAYAAWALLASMIAKSVLASVKFRIGRRIGSAALVADAWNDSVDILSAFTAMAAMGLSVLDPTRFLAADHYGGFAVGLIVVLTGLRVTKDSSDRLSDRMPSLDRVDQIRRIAAEDPRVLAVDKCYARNSGLQYHVDLYLKVDPRMTVRESHELATTTRTRIRQQLDWVADVLIYVEPPTA